MAARVSLEDLCSKERAVEVPVKTCGQVVHIRRKSRLLCFVDLRAEGDARVGAEGRVTAVCKSAELGHDSMRELRTSVRLGDVVEVEGLAQSLPGALIPCVLVFAYALQSKWAQRGGPPFAPQPLGGDAFAPPPPPPPPPAAAAPAGVESGGESSESEHEPDALDGAPRARRAPPPPRHCVHFVSTGRCATVGCTFLHALPAEGRAAWLVAQRATRSARGAAIDDPLAPSSKARHSARAEVFADWLVATYGADALRAGGVVDVAGGRGDLAFALCTRRGIPTTVVDPRHAALRKEQHRFLAAHPHAPRATHVVALFDDAFVASARGAALLAGAALVVGMHPDQATGQIVEAASALRKPWAIVPCCVFAGQFGGRRRPRDGALVSSYDDLVAWLELAGGALPGEVQTAFLGFAGRNRALYRTRYDDDSAPLCQQCV
jgi:hypothetical protein